MACIMAVIEGGDVGDGPDKILNKLGAREGQEQKRFANVANSVYYGFLGLTGGAPAHEAERLPGALVVMGFALFCMLFAASYTGSTAAVLIADSGRRASITGKLPRYRWHLGCILLKMPAISLLTGPAVARWIGRIAHTDADVERILDAAPDDVALQPLPDMGCDLVTPKDEGALLLHHAAATCCPVEVLKTVLSHHPSAASVSGHDIADILGCILPRVPAISLLAGDEPRRPTAVPDRSKSWLCSGCHQAADRGSHPLGK